MKLSDFKFTLPQELIAFRPAEQRDESRLMVINRKTGEIGHRIFKDITEYFDEGDVFIFNNSKVFPAYLEGHKEGTGAFIQVILLRELDPKNRFWDILVNPARKIRISNKLYFGENKFMTAEVIDNTTSRGRIVRFLFDGNHDEFKKALYELENAPLPAYIGRLAEPSDKERYQTVFATKESSIIAPAAGFHFNRLLFKRLEIKDCRFAFLTLHFGLGNFREIDVEDLGKYNADSEQMFIDTENVKTINTAKDKGNQVCAVGISVMKAIETAVCTNGHLKKYEGWTNNFFPPSL